MSLKSTHPLYAENIADWQMMRDLYKGERAVKAKGETYLPATSGMRMDGMDPGKPGYENYQSYKLRAVFPDYVREGVEVLIGLLHQKPPTIELPSALEAIREKATVNGESLEVLLRRVTEEQLTTGRLGLLLDLPMNPDPTNPVPYVALYSAECLRNWDEGQENEGMNNLNLVVLDESNYVRDGFEWKWKERFRVLQLGQVAENETGEAPYLAGVFSDESYSEEGMKPPMLRGKTLKHIPFVFMNTKDVTPQPDDPPLLGLGRTVLAIYRGEADYRHSLFMQGQDTLVIIGQARNPDGVAGVDDDAIRVGAGSRIDVEMGGDAKFIGVDSSGIPEQRQSLENDHKRAETKAGKLINGTGSDVESGEALRTRMAAQTASLKQIAMTAAFGLQQVLRSAALWLGANPDEVKVVPNVEFTTIELTGKDLTELMTARTMGAPLSKESIHALMVNRGLTKMTYDDETDLISEEDAGLPAPGAAGTGATPKLGAE